MIHNYTAEVTDSVDERIPNDKILIYITIFHANSPSAKFKIRGKFSSALCSPAIKNAAKRGVQA
jgi:hypothetical protein